MSDMEPEEYKIALDEKLKLTENLWLQLTTEQWNQSGANQILALSQQIGEIALSNNESAMAELASRLEQSLFAAVASDTPLRLQGIVLALLKRLRLTLNQYEAGIEIPTELLPAVSDKILIISIEDLSELLARLKDSGFKTRQIRNFDDGQKALSHGTPLVLIVDLDAPGSPLGGAALVARMRSEMGMTAPVLFLSHKNDLDSRLLTVQTGGAGFFSLPVKTQLLISRLKDLVIKRPINVSDRVLLISDDQADVEAYTSIFKVKDLVFQICSEPRTTLETIRSFHPQLIILDLELKMMNGVELYTVIRQCELGEDLPMVLLSSQIDMQHQLLQLEGNDDDLLQKPVAPEYLVFYVKQHLRHLKSVKFHLDTLGSRDTLTGLFTRQRFLTYTERHFLDKERVYPASIMLIMIANMQEIRERVNAVVADEIISSAAREFGKSVKGIDSQASRFSDGIFAVLFSGIERDDLLKIARRVSLAITNAAYMVDDEEIALNICIGIGVEQETGGDYLSLIHNADLACIQAHASLDEPISLMPPKLEEVVDKDSSERLVASISDAAQSGRIKLLFQPVVSLQGGKEECYELFVRLYDSDERELHTEAVFNIIKDNPISHTLDRWVIGQAIRIQRDRQKDGAPLVLFINISPYTMKDETLFSWVDERVKNAGSDLQGFVFELTESIVVEYMSEAQHFIKSLKALGARFSLQQVQGDHVSMKVISQLELDYVKPANSMLVDLGKEKEKQERLNGLVRFCSDQGVTTIAMGIEELHTLPLIWSAGMGMVQGYFLQQPNAVMNYDFHNSPL
ncbi:MAG: EAL domain-containing protein [Gammaproteobacteria bacterium]|nr:EAL domain-containing protein [Gammaproteobacteria bacterium]